MREMKEQINILTITFDVGRTKIVFLPLTQICVDVPRKRNRLNEMKFYSKKSFDVFFSHRTNFG